MAERYRRRHNTGTTDNGATVDDVNNQGEDIQASPGRQNSPARIPKDEDPDDLDNGVDNNYLPKSKEDESLGDEDYIVPEDPYEQERFRRRLVATDTSPMYL